MNYKKKLDKLTNKLRLLLNEMTMIKESLTDNIICNECQTTISYSIELINKINCPFCYTKIKSE